MLCSLIFSYLDSGAAMAEVTDTIDSIRIDDRNNESVVYIRKAGILPGRVIQRRNAATMFKYSVCDRQVRNNTYTAVTNDSVI